MNKLYNDDTVASIANAIRSKNHKTNTYTLSDMVQAIAEIETNPEPTGTKNITFNGKHDVGGKKWAQVNVPSDVYEPDTIVANGTYTPTGHDGFSKVVVNINDAPELQNKTVTATSFPCEVIPDAGYYGLNKATVNYTPPAVQESKSATVAYGQSITVTPDDGYASLEEVTVTATQPTGSTSITANGTYDVKQYANAVVNVPAPTVTLQDKTVTTNGSVTADAGYDGLGTVTVNVPQPSGTINITENGTVDVTNYSSANVQVGGGVTRIERGSFIGDDTQVVDITHSLGEIPDFIYIGQAEGGYTRGSGNEGVILSLTASRFYNSGSGYATNEYEFLQFTQIQVGSTYNVVQWARQATKQSAEDSTWFTDTKFHVDIASTLTGTRFKDGVTYYYVIGNTQT